MFTSITPGGPVGEFVESIWLHEGGNPARRAELRLPTGAVELMFNLREDSFRLPGGTASSGISRGAVVAGPYRRAYVLDTTQQSRVLGVVFRPGGARPLVEAPLHELCERHVPLEELWGADADLVRERVLAAPDAGARLRTLESVLRERLARRAEAAHSAVAHPAAVAATACLSGALGSRRIGRLGERLGWTPRRVEQVFRADVGLSPKAYQRLWRFRAALEGIDEAGRLGWPAFATAHGYYDQAHLIREFRSHCGLPPTEYLRRRGERLNHVPLPV
ncbi:helix-turn-helix domain-containing protein [Actinopolyspora alba]|nr:helix-turn-helix domain-containing protein [Actinopolyspora alba]